MKRTAVLQLKAQEFQQPLVQWVGWKSQVFLEQEQDKRVSEFQQ
jgi:hypothetical protein